MYITKRLPRETGRDYTLRILKDNIIKMELEPGSMVSENELSAALGLSRTPVREALIELSKVSIVEIYPQKGSRIALIDSSLVGQAYFMRKALECEVIREVCGRAEKSDLDRLRASIHVQEQFEENCFLESSGREEVTFMELDNQFHELLYQIAGKELVYRITQELMIHFDRIRNLTIDYVKPRSVIEEHKEILRAVEEGEAELAAALVGHHLGRFQGIEEELREKHPTYFGE